MKLIGYITTALIFANTAVAQNYLSPCDIDLSLDRKTVYVTAATGKQVLCFDKASKTVVRSIPLPGEPTGLIPNGQNLIVTGGGHNGLVWILQDGQVVREIETGHTPMAPVLSPGGNTLYVCNRFDNHVSFIDLESGETTSRVPVAREPVAADLTPDGKYLFVANLIPDGRADIDYVASKISVINTQTKEVKTIPLVNGAEGVRGLKISPDGKKVFATHLMARFLVPTTQLERGWVSTDALSVIDVATQTLEYTVLLDDVDQGFPNPWAIGFSDNGRTLVVSSAGNHEISLIDLPAMTIKIETGTDAHDGAAHLNAHSSLSFLSGLRRRIKLQGNGPRSLAVDGEFIYIGNYFSDTLEIVRVSANGKMRGAAFPLGTNQALTPERQGEIHFNDAALCFQNWLSCATCHPDARTDAMNWDLLNDGMGNPKNVKSMLLAHRTPPTTWLGIRPDAETSVRSGILHIQFASRPEEDAAAIDAYLKSLEPVPSPHLEDGKLSRSAERGKELFEQSGCVNCHPPPLYTDLKSYNLGTASGPDEGLPVDVPQLVEVWRTAPYLHDGRAVTIPELLTDFNHGGTRGKLSDEELRDLTEYILSL
jgi:YVTN family beta-propeller protein